MTTSIPKTDVDARTGRMDKPKGEVDLLRLEETIRAAEEAFALYTDVHLTKGPGHEEKAYANARLKARMAEAIAMVEELQRSAEPKKSRRKPIVGAVIALIMAVLGGYLGLDTIGSSPADVCRGLIEALQP